MNGKSPLNSCAAPPTQHACTFTAPCNLNGGPMTTILLGTEVEVKKEKNMVVGRLTRTKEQGVCW